VTPSMSDPPRTIRRVLVLGSSGAGKSTLAATLAGRLDLPHVPTDQAYWTDVWRPVADPQVRDWIDKASAAEAWVMDGNFDSHREILWARADAAIFLDLPPLLKAIRVARRNLGWALSGESIWGGQRMTLPRAWSGLCYAMSSHAQKRRDYPRMLADFPQLRVVRLGSPVEVRRWLAGATADLFADGRP
jgi:energy-coupling factor transporter ATP-binding protein EcfA2